MVAATRLAEKNALLHILNDILNLEDDSKLHRACEYDIVTSPPGLIFFTTLDFNEYRASKMYLAARAGLPNPNPTTAGAIASLPFVRPRDPLGEYRRGVRRDPNAFVSLKEVKHTGYFTLSWTKILSDDKLLRD
jgi:hypothetical protein